LTVFEEYKPKAEKFNLIHPNVDEIDGMIKSSTGYYPFKRSMTGGFQLHVFFTNQ
jgi:hypothetical protein